MATYYKDKTETRKFESLGLVHTVFGQGVGKTTAAIGLAVRAAGADLSVHFIQFMKSGDSAEIEVLRRISNIRYFCPGKHPWILERGPDLVHHDHALKALNKAVSAVSEGAQVIVCDEILNTLLFEVLTIDKITDLISLCRGRIELIMTGSAAPSEVIELSDYVTELVQIKHPYYQGIEARRGIEY